MEPRRKITYTTYMTESDGVQKVRREPEQRHIVSPCFCLVDEARSMTLKSNENKEAIESLRWRVASRPAGNTLFSEYQLRQMLPQVHHSAHLFCFVDPALVRAPGLYVFAQLHLLTLEGWLVPYQLGDQQLHATL